MNSDEIKRLRELAGGMAEVEAVAAAFDHLEALQASHARLLEAADSAEIMIREFENLFETWTKMLLSYIKDGIDAEAAAERIMPWTKEKCDILNKHQARVMAAIDAAKELHDAE